MSWNMVSLQFMTYKIWKGPILPKPSHPFFTKMVNEEQAG